MKILKEENLSKETLPISFVTDLVSKGWDEVGYLKDAIAAISEDFNNTDKISALMQDLMDAYLVFIGQLEFYLQDEADMSTANDDTENSENVKETDNNSDSEDSKKEEEPEEDDSEDDSEDDDEDDDEDDETEAAVEKTTEKDNLIAAEIEPEQLAIRSSDASKKAFDEFADFFVDFDEPDMTKPPISEEELYGEENSEYEFNKLKSQLN